MYNLKKLAGYWCVILVSSDSVMFKTLSRATASEWLKTNETTSARLNTACGFNVWS
jgi:hypothetical protein